MDEIQTAKPTERRSVTRRVFLLATGGAIAGGVWWWANRGPTAGERPVGAPDLGCELFPDAKGRPIAKASDAPVEMVPRSAWTQEKPALSSMQVMGKVERITVHHTGFTQAWEKDGWAATVAEIGHVRAFHTGKGENARGWADIGYHFLVDRAGRVWQGRPLAYQGAHVKNHNLHNAGIVLLGNFDIQRPAVAQLVALTDFLGFLRRLYGVPPKAVFTHGELGQTGCPGKHLQGYMDRLREGWR